MKTKTMLAFLSAAVLAAAAMPMTCSAAEFSFYQTRYTEEPIKVDFAVLGFAEKDGELSITGCYDYEDSEILLRSGNYIAVAVFDGEMTIPSHINDMPVTAIGNLSGYEKIKKLIVPVTVTDISSSAYSGCNMISERADVECRLGTYGYLVKQC